MVAEEKTSNSIYIVPDILEGIFLRLPLKSILKLKTVSKEWKSILESNIFVERHMNVQKRRIIIAGCTCLCGDRPRIIREAQSDGDAEVIVYLHCTDERASMACDGLVCIPEPDSITVLNPSTRQLLRFPSGPDPMSYQFINDLGTEPNFFRINWAMGFGRDKVTGRYKVARMCFHPGEEGCNVLDVESGEWRNLRVPPYVAQVGRQSVCVNGSIYWLSTASYLIGRGCRILALDLHKQDFHYVSVPPKCGLKQKTQLANLEDRLTIANTSSFWPERILEIFTMNAQEEIWTKTYSINLAALDFMPPSMWFTPLAVSKQGNLLLYNDHHWLFKYNPDTHEGCCLSEDICVISSCLENLVPLRSESGHHPDPDYNQIKTSSCRFVTKSSRISKFFKMIGFRIPEIVFTTLVVFLFLDKPLPR